MSDFAANFNKIGIIFPLFEAKNYFCAAIADMAQLVEQRIRNAWVAGSSPAIGSGKKAESEQVRPFPFIGYFFADLRRRLAVHSIHRIQSSTKVFVTFIFFVALYFVLFHDF